MRANPKTMAELMVIVDKYATAGSSMKQPILLDAVGRIATEPATRNSRTDPQVGGRTAKRDHDTGGKRKAYADDQNESKVVATTEGRTANGFHNRRLRTSSNMRWARTRNNYKSLLDRHSRNHGDRPASHTVRECRLSRPMSPPRYDRQVLPPPPPLPAIEAGRDDWRRDNRHRDDRNRDDRQRDDQRRLLMAWITCSLVDPKRKV